MKSIGNLVAPIIYGHTINPDAIGVLGEAKWQCEGELARIGVVPVRAWDLIARAEARFLATAHLCESPIEQMMLAAMAFMVIDGCECFPPAIHDVMSGDEWPAVPVVIVPQFVIARYRLDFLVSIKAGIRTFNMAVECDGRENHSSLEDRARDVTRDTYLSNLGIATWRASGKEIFRKNWKIADEISAVCKELRGAA